MLLQPSVSRFSKTKLQLNHSKNMFNFGAYRGFLMLTAFDLCLGACGVLLTLAGTAIDFVVDRLTGLVLLQRSWSLLRSEIAAVPIDLFLISGKKFRGHRNIMLVGSCHFYRMNQTTFFIYSDMGFIAKVPSLIAILPHTEYLFHLHLAKRSNCIFYLKQNHPLCSIINIL